MKRYNPSYSDHKMMEHPQGDYVRYEDVPGWVSVEERMPRIDDDIVYWGYMNEHGLECHGTTFLQENGLFACEEDNMIDGLKVKYWQPLNPPEKDDD